MPMLSDEQELAAEYSYEEPVVVTAAAGSGKTTLLVERVIRLLLKRDPVIRSDSLAVMTFTRNATKSLREKLNRELNNKLADTDDPDLRAHIKEQIFGLRQAYISTIDAFCLRIIRENPEAFELPLNFTLADTPKKTAMQLRAIGLAMQDLYNEDAVKQAFTKDERDLLFYTFSFEDDSALQEAVMSVADKLSTFADADGWLSDAEDAYDDINKLGGRYLHLFEPDMKKFFLLAREIIKDYDGLADELDEECTELAEKANGEKCKADEKETIEQYISEIVPAIKEYIRSDLERLEEFCQNYNSYKAAPSLQTLCKAISDYRAHGSPPKAEGTGGKRTNARKKFGSAKNKSEALAKDILKNDFDYDDTVAALPRQKTAIHAFIKLVKLYREYYNSVKRASGCLDFADCELLLLKKLYDEEFRNKLSERFSCIVVDEFQDSNDIQAEIFRLLGNDHRFYVGDVKQSIYAFRGGNPEIMAKLCEENNAEGFKALPLNNNYRSREKIIDVVNAAFSGLMTREYGGVDYDPGNKLAFSAKLPEIPDEHSGEYNCELWFFNGAKSKDKDMTSPRMAAKRIRELHDNENFKISKKSKTDKDKLELARPKYSDFAILVRNKTHIQDYREALSELGISSVTPKGQRFLDSEEITLILNYLAIIDNPLRDEELLKVLMSPLYRFTAEEVGQLRLGLLGLDGNALNDGQKKLLAAEMKRYSLFHCARICTDTLTSKYCRKMFDGLSENTAFPRRVNEKLAAFYRDLDNFRYYTGGSSVYRLTCKVCDDTDLASVCAVFEDSARRVANVRYFQEIAADFEARDGGGLSDFLRFIERVRKAKNNSVEDASRPADNTDAVQIMTFHASKGLEVPVCILADLEGSLNRNDFEGTTLINREHGLAMTDVDIKNRLKRNTFAHCALEKVNRLRMCGEELRLLYVAMTRAQEKLIMMVKSSASSWNKAEFDENKEGSRGELFGGSVPFKWIYASLLRHYDKKEKKFTGINCDLIDLTDKKKRSDSKDDDTPENDSTAAPSPVMTEARRKVDPEKAERLSKKIQFVYKYDEDTRRREKYSVTELAHRNSAMPVVIKKPRFALDPEEIRRSKLYGADKGNAYHNCMQHIPLEELKAAPETEYEEIISRAVRKMTERNILTALETEIIEPERIADFFRGDMGQRVLRLRTDEVCREWAFYAEVNGPDIGEDDLDGITIQGRIDLYFIENGEIVVVDYKTDTAKNLENEMENYRKQLKMYRTILPMLTKYPVKSSYLYSFAESKAIEIKDEK